jgi:hypothetical protein
MLHVQGDVDNTSGAAGESAGLIHEIKSVQQIVDETIAGFWREIDRLAALRRASAAKRLRFGNCSRKPAKELGESNRHPDQGPKGRVEGPLFVAPLPRGETWGKVPRLRFAPLGMTRVRGYEPVTLFKTDGKGNWSPCSIQPVWPGPLRL